MTELTITDLYIYPLKSAGAVRVDSFTTDRMGPEDDRRWMLVDAKGKFITQREFPRMALIEVGLSVEHIEFNAPGMGAISLAKGQESTAGLINVQVWRDHCDAVDCGDVAAQWFSEYLKTPCRLAVMPDSTRRYVDKDYCSEDQTVGFADGFPMLLISEASLEDLNARLRQPVPMLRFRPNVVVSGCEAFAEDGWQQLTGQDGGTPTVAKSCARCIIPSIDFTTGKQDSEVLQVLRKFRLRDDGLFYFGQNLLCQDGCNYQVGQVLTVIA